MEENWDYLIVLDACRYDYFSRVYQDYFQGKLSKVKSKGTGTFEWCTKSFKERYDDVVYVSANPYINSKHATKDFQAKDHFYKIIDVWDWGWDKELGSVHPKEVNEATITTKAHNPDKRLIIHYLQPHAPYINYNISASGFPCPDVKEGRVLTGIHKNQSEDQKMAINNIPKGLENLLRILGSITYLIDKKGFPMVNLEWKTREIFGLPATSPMDAMRRKVGIHGLREAYLNNLRFVLEFVTELLESLSGITVITADHGERLGEMGSYSHGSEIPDPLLYEVPWFEVSETKPRKLPKNDDEKRRIQKVIKEMKGVGVV